MNQILHTDWKPYSLDPIQLTVSSLEKNWPRLHVGNSEPFPSIDAIDELLQDYPIIAASIGNHSTAEISGSLIQGWLEFHKGNYQKAAHLALASGLAGLNLASKSIALYATHLETDDALKLELFKESIRLAEHAIEVMPENPEAHYNRAYAMGRYSQGISITKALAEGYGKEVRKSLEKTLELAPKHAEAHIAFGTYHAEIINQVGKLVASISYGANKDSGLKHFRTALRFAPNFPIGFTQYADGLLMMFGSSKLKEAKQLYDKAASATTVDAMEKLDQKAAIDELATIS
jgi:tetratricopeptide (TPR) repeat protein